MMWTGGKRQYIRILSEASLPCQMGPFGLTSGIPDKCTVSVMQIRMH